jgi:hypothetical protein
LGCDVHSSDRTKKQYSNKTAQSDSAAGSFLLWNTTLLKVAFVTDLKLPQQVNNKGPLEGETEVSDQQQRQYTYA